MTVTDLARGGRKRRKVVRARTGPGTHDCGGDDQRNGDPMGREAILTRTFVELADTLVADFDVVELLTLVADRCVEALDVGAAGLMLAAPDGDLRVMASSSDAMRLLELFELQSQEGPCLDCYRSGQPEMDQDLGANNGRWPTFAAEALAAGFHSVNALPMRLRGELIGALNLFHVDAGEMQQVDVDAAQALADVATIAILQHRAALEADALNDQLNYALKSRIVIEQAKGIVGGRKGVDMEQAFTTLRNHARSHNLRLTDVARDVINGTLSATALDGPTLRRKPSHAPHLRCGGGEHSSPQTG